MNLCSPLSLSVSVTLALDHTLEDNSGQYLVEDSLHPCLVPGQDWPLALQFPAYITEWSQPLAQPPPGFASLASHAIFSDFFKNIP